MKGRKYYVRVSSFSLSKVLMALLNDDNVEEVRVSLEDNELLVSFNKKETSNKKETRCPTMTPTEVCKDWKM